jgi:thiol-disulfide isomerase/thioredoxin
LKHYWVKFIAIFICCNGAAQSSIIFNDLSLQGALLVAKERKQNIFIDTYADWCMPCKKMEQEFKKNEIASFFNENYVNIRINMENSPNAEIYKKEFDIVFLPTMILLDPNGNIKYKTDKIISGQELLLIAKKSMSANVYFLNESTDIIRDPMTPGSQNTNSTREVIVHKLGDPNQNPEIMLKEAYFRIELMDGSHRKTAKNYLDTQDDWSTKKNKRFILDFLYTVKSKEFVYLIKQIDEFIKEFGHQEIEQTLSIVINDELQNGFPRPSYEKVLELYGLINTTTAEEETMKYFMERYLDECNFKAYKSIAMLYLQKYSTDDAEIFATLGLECISKKVDNEQLQSCIESTQKAIELQNKVPFYYEQLAQLYILKKDKKQAAKSLQKAQELAKTSNHDLKYYSKLQTIIEKL